MTRYTLAPLSLACLCALALACTDAGRCHRGTEGCATNRDGSCNRGLVAKDGMCVEDEAAQAGSSGSDAGESGSSAPPVECEGDTLTEACGAFCEALCHNEEQLCVESRCAANDCDPDGVVFRTCEDICEGESDPTNCALNLCRIQLDHTCESFGAVDSETSVYQSLCFGSDPNCVGNADYGCSDLCGTIDTAFGGVGGDLAGNGICEDGGEGSDSDVCARGTDCTDCGPRECAAVGDGCDGPFECCGFYSGGALCVRLTDGPTCLETCTETGVCPDDLTCREVNDNRNSVCAP